LMRRRQAETGNAKSLGAVDRNVNGEVDEGNEPEPRRDDQDQCYRNRQMYQAMYQQRQRSARLLILAVGHPRILQEKIRNHVLGGEEKHPSHQRANRNRR
jgi:hypothetical protein